MPSSAQPILRQIPNALTVLRVLLAVLFPLSPGAWRPAVVLTALASEYLDGAISRRFGFQTRFGRMLDPVADKLFFGSVAFTLLAEGVLGKWELALLALRDIGVLVALGWFVATRQWKRLAGLRPGLAGKLTTVLQYAAMVSLLFFSKLHPALVLLTAAAGAVSVVRYYQQFGPRVGSEKVES